MTNHKSIQDIQNEIQLLCKQKQGRIIVGITGIPGVGKSTLSEKLVARLNDNEACCAAYLPMDGFHMTNEQLLTEGKLQKKGAIETFDIDGFIKILNALKQNIKVEAPIYDREIHDVVPKSILIDKQKIIVTEGIFLLAEVAKWKRVKTYLDYCYFLEADNSIVRQRLIERHLKKHNKLKRAEVKYNLVDKPNIKYVRLMSVKADCIFFLT